MAANFASFMCLLSRNSRSLNVLDPSERAQASTGNDFTVLYTKALKYKVLRKNKARQQ